MQCIFHVDGGAAVPDWIERRDCVPSAGERIVHHGRAYDVLRAARWLADDVTAFVAVVPPRTDADSDNSGHSAQD